MELGKNISPKAELQNLVKIFHSERNCRTRFHEDICPRAKLQKQNFGRHFPRSRRNALAQLRFSYSTLGIAEVYLCQDISLRAEMIPQSGVAEAEHRKDNTPRVELRKQNFLKTFPIEQNCGSGTSQRHYPRTFEEADLHKNILSKAELQKLNFVKTFPSERNC